MIAYLHTIVRNNAGRSYTPFTQFPLMAVAFWKREHIITPGNWNQYSQGTEHCHHHKYSPHCPFIITPLSSSSPLPHP